MCLYLNPSLPSVEADEELFERRICAHTKTTEHRVFKGKLEIQRGDTTQMWQMGSANGAVFRQKVRIYLLYILLIYVLDYALFETEKLVVDLC